MRVQTPEENSQTTPEAATYVIPSVGSSIPGMCGSPAEAGRGGAAQNIAPTSATTRSNLFTGQSPLVELVDGSERVPARTAHDTTPTDPDLALFRALADRQDFDSLTTLCRERLLTSRDVLTSLRWTKDRAIVECYRGNFTAAYDLLATVHSTAQAVEGAPRGKYEQEFGIVLARLGRSSLALDRFNVAFQMFKEIGDRCRCAGVDTARARALVTRGETHKALRYLNRAERVATKFADYRLLADVSETKAEAFGVWRRERGRGEF